MADLDVIEPIPRLDPIVAIGKDELVEGGLEGAANRPIIALANQVAYVMDRTYSKTDVDDLAANLEEMISAAEKGVLFFETAAELLATNQGVENKTAQARDTGKLYLWKIKSAVGVTPVVWGWVDTGLSDRDFATAKANTAEANAKNYINAKTNLNFFRGFDQNAVSTFLLTYTLNQTSDGVTMNGGRLQLTLPTNGKLSNNCSVWVNVKNAVLGAGVIRSLVQVRKKDATNVHSNYYNIPNDTIGWYKLVDVNLSAINPSDIDAVIVNPEATGGAVLTISDVYVGESTPNNPFTRIDKVNDDIIRSAVKTNLIPKTPQLPIITGVTYTEERISISAGVTFEYIMPVSNKQILYFSMLLNQVTNRDTRFRFIGTPTDGSAAVTRDVYTSAVNGMEFSSSVDFGKPIKELRLNITSLTANAVSLDRFILSHDPVLQSKRVSQVKLPSAISDLIDDSVVNIASFPKFEQITSKANALWTEQGLYLSNESNITMRQSISELGLVPGDIIYLNLKGNVLKNAGVVSITQAQIKQDNTSMAGTTTNLNDGNNLFINIPITVAADASLINITLRTTGNATLSATDLIISKQKVYSYSKIITKYAEDETGTQVSLFPYPKLTGYDTVGNQIAYNRYLDDNNDWILEVPNTDTTVARGQGATFNIPYPDSLIGKGGLLNVMLASPTANTVAAYVIFKVGESIVQQLAFNMPVKDDGSFSERSIQLAAKSNANANITSASVTFHQANTATGPLRIKRPLLTADFRSQSVKHIEYAIEEIDETGVPQRNRVYDAIRNPVNGVFSTGKQMFVSEVDNPSSISDFKVLNGREDLPKKLIGTKYINANGFEIITIDSDETVYLRNTANTNIYKTTVDDLYSRISAPTLDSASGEYRGVFNGDGLTIVASGFASNMWGKVSGDGSLICVTQTQALYLPENGTSLVAATGYADVKGGLITGWLFDVVDNIVLAGGYSASPTYGKGRINFSNDHGRTYKTILDLENQSIFGVTATAKAHIHGCAWDKYWNRVWVVMGDYPFDDQAVGKILWCDNPQDANPVWHLEPRDLIQPNKQNEQHIAVYPMQDCILFGSDCNPSYIARRARVSKGQATLTDMALYLHEGLAYYPAQFWRHNDSLPVTIFLGSDLLDRYGDNPDGVLITYDGVNFSRVWSDKNEYSNTSGRTSSYAYALTKERFLLQKRVDPRFSSGTCWVMGRLRMR